MRNSRSSIRVSDGEHPEDAGPTRPAAVALVRLIEARRPAGDSVRIEDGQAGAPLVVVGGAHEHRGTSVDHTDRYVLAVPLVPVVREPLAGGSHVFHKAREDGLDPHDPQAGRSRRLAHNHLVQLPPRGVLVTAEAHQVPRLEMEPLVSVGTETQHLAVHTREWYLAEHHRALVVVVEIDNRDEARELRWPVRALGQPSGEPVRSEDVVVGIDHREQVEIRTDGIGRSASCGEEHPNAGDHECYGADDQRGDTPPPTRRNA